MNLEPFRKKNPKKKAIIIGCISLVLLVTIVIVYRSFAFYEETNNFNIIQGQVPDQNYDLMFRYTMEDANGNRKFIDTMPSKGDYIVTVSCNNGATGEWNEELWAPLIKNFTKIRTKCTINFKS